METIYNEMKEIKSSTSYEEEREWSSENFDLHLDDQKSFPNMSHIYASLGVEVDEII